MGPEGSLEFKKTAGGVTDSPELDLGFSDAEIIEIIGRKIDQSVAFYKEKRVDERTKSMVEYWKGEQVSAKEKDAGRTYNNNIIHRDLGTRAQNATSRIPDIVVMSPQQSEDLSVRQQARGVEEWLGIRLDSDVLRRLAKNAVIDNHLKLRGVWKYRYDHARKDAVIDRLRPQDVIFDHTARIPEDGFTADNMEFVAEWLEEPTAVVMAKFPAKREELLADLDREATEKGLRARASKIRYMEVWATMHREDGTPREIIFWKYNDMVLDKRPNPYWDESEEPAAEFGMEPEKPSPLAPPPPLPAPGAVPGMPPEAPGAFPPQPDAIPPIPAPQEGPSVPARKNHFAFARKPYTVFSGENIGDGPLDDTTVVEVAMPMQDVVNRRGNQISLINDWAVPKIVTSEAYMTEEKASNITRDPTEIIVLKETEDVRAALVAISGVPASPALYNDLQEAIAAIDAHFSTNPASRGENSGDQSGISKQISREGDLASADEIAQNMVQRAVEEAANWLVQLAKIYFDEPRHATAPGRDRAMRSASISSKLIPDNIQIVVKSSSVDKPTRRDMDMHLASMKAIDPFTLYEDLDYPNPKEMAHRLIDFLNGPQSGYVKYLQDIGSNPLEPAGQQSEGEAAPGSGLGAPMPAPAPGAPPVVPQGLPAGGQVAPPAI